MPADELFRQAREKFDLPGIRLWSYYSATLKETADLESAIPLRLGSACEHVTGDATGGIAGNKFDRRFTQEI